MDLRLGWNETDLAPPRKGPSVGENSGNGALERKEGFFMKYGTMKRRNVEENAVARRVAKASSRPLAVDLDRMTPAMRKRHQEQEKRKAFRAAQELIKQSRVAERKLEDEMKEVLAPSELQWIDGEHFRLMCGSGVDESFVYLGFRAMLRALEEPKMRSISSLDRAALSKRRLARTSAKDLQKYRKFLLEHLNTLDTMLDEKRHRLLVESVQRQVPMFLESGRKSWPTNLAVLIHCTAERE